VLDDNRRLLGAGLRGRHLDNLLPVNWREVEDDVTDNADLRMLHG
jgi:hypothetical protein